MGVSADGGVCVQLGRARVEGLSRGGCASIVSSASDRP